jgi:hypothetical protein
MPEDTVQFDASAHTYTVGNRRLPGVTTILRAAGLLDQYDAMPVTTREFAFSRGRAVHTATRLYDEQDLDESTLDPAVAPYLTAWISFRSMCCFDPIHVETPVHSAAYQYAGTLDRIGTIRLPNTSAKTRCLLDIKTGPVQPWVRLQTAAYQYAARERGIDPGVIRFGLSLRQDGTWQLSNVWMDPADWQVFAAARLLVSWKEQNA